MECQMLRFQDSENRLTMPESGETSLASRPAFALPSVRMRPSTSCITSAPLVTSFLLSSSPFLHHTNSNNHNNGSRSDSSSRQRGQRQEGIIITCQNAFRWDGMY